MVRLAIILLLTIHGLIHFRGVASPNEPPPQTKANISTQRQNSASTHFTLKAAWMMAGVLFIVTAFLYYKGWPSWWWVGALAVLLSQVLIISQWREAWYGTFVNLLLLVIIIAAFANQQFSNMVDHEVAAFVKPSPAGMHLVSEKDLEKLPVPVQRWMRRSNVLGKPVPQYVYVEQEGEMRTTPSGKWMPVQAHQYFSTGQPGFIWTANVKAAPLLNLKGRDMLVDGKGNMLIKALAIYPVANASGKAIDQGALVRYLAEIAWFPAAAISPYIQWQSVDDTTAQATITKDDMTVSGLFTFSPGGDPVSFEALRYYDRKGGATLEKWVIQHDPHAYKQVENTRIPTASTVTWKLSTGDFTWFKVNIGKVDYNPLNMAN